MLILRAFLLTLAITVISADTLGCQLQAVNSTLIELHSALAQLQSSINSFEANFNLDLRRVHLSLSEIISLLRD